MENKRKKLNNGEWNNDCEYQDILQLNKNLKDFMKEALHIELKYKEKQEQIFYPNDPNSHQDWWGEVRRERTNHIDGLFYSTEEAVDTAYNEMEAQMSMFKAFDYMLSN